MNSQEASMKKFYMFTPSSDGGMAQYAWELLHALSALPHREYSYELVSGEDLQPQFKSEAYPVHAILPMLRHRSEFANKATWVASRLTHYPRRERFFLRWLGEQSDVAGVHFQEWTPWLAAGMFRKIRKMGIKTYYTVHNVVPHHYPPVLPRAVMHNWIRKGCMECDGLFVHTNRLAEDLSRFLGNSHPRIQVVPHGVWTVRNAADVPKLEERLKWKKLLFFGSIRRNKGLDLLLSAAETLKDYSITIAGEPQERQYYETEILPRIEKLRAAGVKIDLRAKFTPDHEVGPLFASHSAIVLPYTKGFVAQSGVIFMALAYELPVVASEAGGMKDLFRDFKVGVTFKDSTPEELASAITALHAGNCRHDIIAEIRAAKRRLSWNESARATVAGYNRTSEEGREADACAVETTPAL
jgi:glycosyltransferase involved in cell wall biosynthesis